MKLRPAVVLVLAAAMPLPAVDTHPFSVSDLLAMDRVADPAVSPDGRFVAFSVRVTDEAANRGRTHIEVSAIDGGTPRRLTTGDGNDSGPAWGPAGILYFLSTRGGSSQVWRQRVDGGEAEQVTRLARDIEAFEVSPDGKRLVLGVAVFPGATPDETKARLEKKGPATGHLYDRLFVRHWDAWADGTRNHLFGYDLARGEAVDLMREVDADCPTKPYGDAADFAIAPDSGSVVFSARDMGREEAWSTNFDLFEVPLDGAAAPRKLTTNPAWDAQPRFSPDGATLGWVAMDRHGFEADRFHFVLRDRKTGTERAIGLRADPTPRGDRSVDTWTWSADGRELYAAAYNTGRKSLFAVDVASGETRLLVSGGHAATPHALPDGRVLYSIESLAGPAELAVVDRKAAKPPRPVTALNAQRVAAARFGEAEQFAFEGAHGDLVHGWVVRPADFAAKKKYPVAFLIHGGPQGSFDDSFHYRWNPQAYAGAGYAAVTIDFHGSLGYGQAFTDAIRDDWGGGPYEDLMKGLDTALERYDFLDGSRVCALGASYGAFMVNWMAGHTDRFVCFVSHDGNLDERAAYFMTEELWFPEWEHGGTPWANPQGYTKHNPADFVANWKTPMLVVHGEKDYRIPYTQGLASFTTLQRRGIPSQLLLFPDENHWVLKPANSRLWHETVLAWLAKWTQRTP